MDEQLSNAMDLAKSGDWTAAHEIVQSRNDAMACRIHGYLHRVEGDDGNAGYWYSRAGCEFPSGSLGEEWIQIVDALNTAD